MALHEPCKVQRERLDPGYVRKCAPAGPYAQWAPDYRKVTFGNRAVMQFYSNSTPLPGSQRSRGLARRLAALLEFSLSEVYTLLRRRATVTTLIYPSTRYTAPALVDISSKEERERLSPSALRAFFSIVDRWNVRDEDARQLLGGISNGPYYRIKKSPEERTLDTDTLLRVSYLIGIFKALNILHSEDLADKWVNLPNRNPIFKGIAPLQYMMRGGIPAMQMVRRLLDARRGGL
jgi:hypothetical protein